MDLIDSVTCLIKETSAEAIEPRFRALVDEDVRQKSPGEVVTVADDEAESILTKRLGELVPDAPVVGEEACSRNPDLISALGGERAWLVDPLDGTANFVAGRPDWAVMVALVEQGATAASWIWRPMDKRMYVAEKGAGATCNGDRLVRQPAPAVASQLRGIVLRRFLDAETAATVDRNKALFAEVADDSPCAGVIYPAMAEGLTDFVLFWRTLAWDHAPGALLATEAGAMAHRLDGTPYAPAQTTEGLVLASDQATWATARRLLE